MSFINRMFPNTNELTLKHMGKIDRCPTTTKHNQVQNMGIVLRCTAIANIKLKRTH